MKKLFERFTLYDIIVIAMMAALGIAVKQVIQPLVQVVTGPLFIPGGTVAGGIYMLFIVLGYAIVRKRFTALLVCAVQAVIVMATGLFGTHGAASLVTYMLPGVGVELLFFFTRLKATSSKPLSAGECFAGGILANGIGAVVSSFVFFNLPLVPLLLVFFTAALSGGLGGLLAFALAKQVDRFRPAGEEDGEDIDIDQEPDEAGTGGKAAADDSGTDDLPR